MTAEHDPEPVKALVRSYFASVAEGRWEDVLALFHPDAELNVAGVRPKIGHDRIRPFYENIGDRFADYAPTVTTVLAEGNLERAVASAMLVLNAVNREGERVQVPAADDFVIEEGCIRSLRIIFDTQLMR
jgi:ketosteroid isomerase-like protein